MISLALARAEATEQPGAQTGSPAAASGPYQGFGYPWENNTLGITSEVPAPWTDIVYRRNRLSCWGRDYDLGRGILPRQIVSQQQPLFAAPPSLTLTVDGRNVELGEPALNRRDTHVAAFTVAQAGLGFDVRAAGTLEYDGLWKVEVTVTPHQPVHLDQLTVKLPFHRHIAQAFSRYMPYDFNLQRMDRAEFTKSIGTLDEPVAMPFNPTVWLGNDQVGLEWVCETDAGWSPAGAGSAIEIQPGERTTVMTVQVVSKPVEIDVPYTFTFALYPTPIKPLPDDWRKKRLLSEDRMGPSLDPRELDVYGVGWAGVPVKYIGLPVMEPSTAIEDPALPAEMRIPNAAARIRDTLHRMKASGVHFIPYGSLYEMPAKLPLGEWNEYARFWTTHGSLDHPRVAAANPRWARMLGLPPGSKSLVHVTLSPKSIRDFVVWHYVRAIKEHDIAGIYFDGGSPHVLSQNPLHPFGQHVAEGGQYYSFFAKRELMKRLWVACKALKPDFFITQHSSKLTTIDSGFADLNLSGEALNVFFRGDAWTLASVATDPTAYVPDYSRLPEVFFSAGYSSSAGTINAFLPQVSKWDAALKNDPAVFEKYSRMMLARTLVYDVPLYQSMTSPAMLGLVNRAYRNFDWLRGVRFVAPAKSDSFLRKRPEALRVGLYLNNSEDRVMMVLSNLGPEPVEEEIALDVEELHAAGLMLPADARVLDAATLEPVPTAPGRHATVRTAIPGNDFRLFIVR